LPDQIYQVVEHQLLTPNVARFFLAASDTSIHYQAGQYIKLVHSDGSTSPFSIANAPQEDGLLEFHLLFLKENRRASDIFQQVKERKTFKLRGPYGSCTLEHMSATKPTIFIARSTGFSPVKAVIEEQIRRGTCPPIHLYWSTPGWRDLYLRDLLHSWAEKLPAFQFTAVLTREVVPPEHGAKYGSVPDLVLQDYPDLSAHQVYLSGPEKMAYAALETFQKKGLPNKCFYSDVFDYQPE
jgi:CDP-4-dehydro-6-deoxyglucose reductase